MLFAKVTLLIVNLDQFFQNEKLGCSLPAAKEKKRGSVLSLQYE